MTASAASPAFRESGVAEQVDPAASVERTSGGGAGVAAPAGLSVGLLTGGDDKSYALGLTSALVEEGIAVDFIGSDALDAPELHGSPLITFLNLRGDQREDAGLLEKVARILVYYSRLLRYAAAARPRLFHVLWNNKFELFDRTVLMGCYRLLGRRVVLTVHNVNAARRDSRDTWLNRASLRLQYRLSHHLFVHTQRMKDELVSEFGVREAAVSVIPFGINNTLPATALSRSAARQSVGVAEDAHTVLFFGQIAPYKGLEYLVRAFDLAAAGDRKLHLIIAGKVKKGHAEYWDEIRAAIAGTGLGDRVTTIIRFIPDDEVERYFKAADAVVLPYTQIFQSGVPFLAYSFGVPVIATDVGSLREDILEGVTGFVCPPRDPGELAGTMSRYFESEVYRRGDDAREQIRRIAFERHSWAEVGRITRSVYESVLRSGGQ